MIKTTCDIPLVKLANKNLKPQKYLKKADSAPNLSKIEVGGVEVKVVTPIFYARILLIFVPSTFVESLKKNMCQFPKVAIPLKRLKKSSTPLEGESLLPHQPSLVLYRASIRGCFP